MAIEHRGVASVDLTGVVEDDDLSGEVDGRLGRVVLRVRAHVTTTEILDGNVLDVETNVVTRDGLLEGFVMHLDGLDLSGHHGGGEGDDHARLEHTGLDTADRHGTDTADLVHILQGQTKRLVNRALRGLDVVKGIEERAALPPRHVRALLKHVITVPARDRDERDAVRVVADLLDEVLHLLLDLEETSLAVVDRLVVHLVDAHDQLLHTEGEGEQGVLTGLTVLGDTSLELTGTGSDDQHTHISLRGTSDHVLDEITMARGVDDGEVVLGGLELPESDINGDTTLTLGLQFVQNPSVLERALAHLLGLLLELLDDTLVDTTALVDQVTGGGRLTGIDVTDHNDVDMKLFLSHDAKRFSVITETKKSERIY
mmetsp:Transcript_23172/g.57992  ORF Transcript_23172/g.57992 Transcript_23172/m.57992 type:complete len:371 (+) Transcript_23172:353-1465(+)